MARSYLSGATVFPFSKYYESGMDRKQNVFNKQKISIFSFTFSLKNCFQKSWFVKIFF